MINFLDEDPKQAISISRIFERMDKDKSGGIDVEELTDGFQILGLGLSDNEAFVIDRRQRRVKVPAERVRGIEKQSQRCGGQDDVRLANIERDVSASGLLFL